MNLKESYRYANFLDKLLDRGFALLRSENFTTIKEQTHIKHKANPNAEDETIVVPKATTIEANPMHIVDLTVLVLNERETLHNAIAEAKKKMEINLDATLSSNKRKHEFVCVLESLNGMKPAERQSRGSDYMLNANNEQTTYYYTINEVVTIDFDRIQVKGLLKKLLKETDAISSKLDLLEIQTQVEFTPVFDVNDTFEDIVEVYVESLNNNS